MARLGKKYSDGEVIVRQGDKGNCMFVIQQGEVDVLANTDDGELQLRTLGPNDFFGEMALFEEEVRTATIRARGACTCGASRRASRCSPSAFRDRR